MLHENVLLFCFGRVCPLKFRIVDHGGVAPLLDARSLRGVVQSRLLCRLYEIFPYVRMYFCATRWNSIVSCLANFTSFLTCLHISNIFLLLYSRRRYSAVLNRMRRLLVALMFVRTCHETRVKRLMGVAGGCLGFSTPVNYGTGIAIYALTTNAFLLAALIRIITIISLRWQMLMQSVEPQPHLSCDVSVP